MRAAIFSTCFLLFFGQHLLGQKWQQVKFVHDTSGKKILISAGDKQIASFIYPDTLEKPVLYPVYAPDGIMVTRGFPLAPRKDESTDHPHHLGLWLNFENVNGLDFWNNSYAIPADKKNAYGHITTQPEIETNDGKKGILVYNANWRDHNNYSLLEEITQFTFASNENMHIIDRMTTLVADTTVVFKDAKDGLLGLRLAHELQIPTKQTKEYTDDKGNVTTVKGVTDSIANGNYLTSEGKEGDSAWSTRGRWCKVYGKMQNDSVSITIIDHPQNPNYPTFWHARGYGLFAANPLGEAVFTNGKSRKDLTLKKGEYTTFRFRIIIQSSDKETLSVEEINKLADEFAKQGAD